MSGCGWHQRAPGRVLEEGQYWPCEGRGAGVPGQQQHARPQQHHLRGFGWVFSLSHLPSSCQDHQFLLKNMQYNSIFIHWLFWGNVFNLTLAQKSTNLWILSRWILLSELSGYFEFICANGCHEIVFSGFRSLSSPAVKGNGQKSNADHWIWNSLPVDERRRVPPPHPQSIP